MSGLPRFWLQGGIRVLLLLPAAALYRVVVAIRRRAYRWGLIKSYRLPVPVLVIGNIFVGGTGKTPLVLWLVHYLRATGRTPGIITRGYGGNAESWPQSVEGGGDPFLLGDEPVMLAERGDCPVMAGPDRVAAAQALVERYGCDVVVSDDGLQHYRLARDLEVVVIDTARGLGNGHCFPAGPLREPRGRLHDADLVVANGGPSWLTPYYFTLKITEAENLTTGERRPLTAFSDAVAHGVAGIGNPERFFAALQRYGIDLVRHPFGDHFQYGERDVRFDDGAPVLMTEKDAVKCRRYADGRHWAVPATTVLTAETERALKARVRGALERFDEGTAQAGRG